MQDLFIAMHTVLRPIGNSASVTVKKNPNRLALIIQPIYTLTVTGEGGNVWYTKTVPIVYSSFVTADTNEAPPTDNTGSITGAGSSQFVETVRLGIDDYGSAVTDGSTVSVNAGTANVFELIADAVLAKMLKQLDESEGWPFVGKT